MQNPGSHNNWIRFAEDALSRMDGNAAHGTLMLERTAIAKSLGLTLGTLANYLDSYRFLLAMERAHPEVSPILRRHAASSVSAYGRWFKHDREGAIGHLLSSPGATSRQVLHAEKAARHGAGRGRRPLLRRIWNGVKGKDAEGPAWVFSRWSEPMAAPNFRDLSIGMNADPLSLNLGAALILSAGPATIGVIDVEPGVGGHNHLRQARSMLGRAALAATRHPLVIVLMPDMQAMEGFRSAIDFAMGDAVDKDGSAFVFSSCMGVVAPMAADHLVEGWSALGAVVRSKED